MATKEEVQKELYDREKKFLEENETDIKDYVNFIGDKSIFTRTNYTRSVLKFKEWANKDISELTFTDFNNYMNKIKVLDDGNESSCGYRINIYAALKLYCKLLYLQKIIPENYMENIPRPKYKESESLIQKREEEYLTEKELHLVLTELAKDTSWHGIRDMAVFQVLLNTGMRSSALRSLDLNNYDSKEGKIIVTDKGSKVITYYLSYEANNYVQKYLKKRDWMADMHTDALFVYRDETFVFDAGRGRPIYTEGAYIANCYRFRRHDLAKIVKKRTEIVGRSLSPHKLRATYGTMLYNKTHDIYFVQKMMNHNSPTTTEIYIRGQENKTKDASEIMSRILRGDDC